MSDVTQQRVLGGIEAGGTKFVCAVGTGPDDIRAEVVIPTTRPDETLARVVDFFTALAVESRPAAIGIGSFGPIDPDPRSPSYGFITTTPKPGWGNFDFAGAVRRAMGVPVGFDTDVNAAGLGEAMWGAAQGLDTFLYLTVGTGIGGGGLYNGRLMHGLLHPEMGHMPLRHDTARDPFPGSCPYHGDCFEGLASGGAIEQRWGARAETLPPEHPAWALEAHYIGQALATYISVLSPQRILLGGGVMSQQVLFPLIRQEVQAVLNGYVQAPAVLEGIDLYIVPPGLWPRSGMLGSLALAKQALGALPPKS